MSDRPVYVISDIHLGGVPDETEREFRRFLRHVGDEAQELVINGDLFDFWFEYRTVVQSRHFRVLASLAELTDRGVRVRFTGGNHDAWGGSFLEEQVGIEIFEEASELELAGRTALVVHGDGRGDGDLTYLALKRFIRNPLVVRAFRMLHPDLGSRVASRVSTTEKKVGRGGGASAERAAALRAWAVAELGRRPHLDLVLAGHTHTPEVEEVEPERFYVNTGDWINHFTYLILRPGDPPDLRVWRPR
jgi:UDP-2,3-diacylglucosamine hydrolase